ncbi:uncharacterized protein SCHCODRAFT_02490361 [Schizophyllum commune H4-8]|uniref:uncharacterized protein n=1 Tax=Schizophyllum commune (strain H4-8 / FGSC 9210) TaxID=578458 RepID=UPI002160903A|nr:uncharacterized protein SCHCODRAFT_02490361 [Schizophyllum commune H4-8]KAI5898770.1 hypothetical protein SCHCODRAFT_02490361 [Schizophyllum commune H4-8]
MSSPYQLALCSPLEKYKNPLISLVSPKANTVVGYRHTLNKYTPRLQMSVRYEEITSGPPNNLTWTSTIYLNNQVYGIGRGSSINSAREAAACQAINALRNQGSIS